MTQPHQVLKKSLGKII